MELTDGELLERWREKDFASGEVLFDRYYPMVERFFLNKISDAVPDLVQDTFARCVENRDKIRDNNQFRLYIFGIAYNVLKAHLRQRYRGGSTVDVGDASVHDVAPGPATLAVRRREHRALLEGLRSIPVDDQVVLELHYWESFTTDDIAEILGIPLGTARGRLQRAREKLGEAIHRLTQSAQDMNTTMASLDGWARDCRNRLDGSG